MYENAAVATVDFTLSTQILFHDIIMNYDFECIPFYHTYLFK